MRWLLILSLIFIAGCARDRYLHEKAQLEETRTTNTMEAYDAFLAKYPDSDWNKTALYYRDQLWVETARNNHDKASLIEFLQTRPDSVWIEQAHYFLENNFDNREKTRLAEIIELNTVEAYEAFLTEYPNSVHRKTIIYQRDKLWVTRGIANKDKASLVDFIRKYPESEWTEQAHYYISNQFNVAEHEDTTNCGKCHSNDFLRNKAS